MGKDLQQNYVEGSEWQLFTDEVWRHDDGPALLRAHSRVSGLEENKSK